MEPVVHKQIAGSGKQGKPIKHGDIRNRCSPDYLLPNLNGQKTIRPIYYLQLILSVGCAPRMSLDMIMYLRLHQKVHCHKDTHALYKLCACP